MKDRLKRIGVTLIAIIVATSPLWVPNLIWHLRPASDVRVSVVDYTVPAVHDPHRGLMWVLNHAKTAPPGDARRWDERDHYTGYYPQDRLNPSRIETADLSATDLLYIADTYGVYEMDLEMLEGVRLQPTHSPLLFGALTPGDVDAIEAFVDSGGDLVTEFNTLPPPTPRAERERMEDMLGVEWTGWVGRIFPDFRDLSDVPDWLEELYEDEYPGIPPPVDPALVLVYRGRDLIVISDPDYTKIVPRLTFTDVGRDWLGNVRADAALFNWFALVEADESTDVLAELVLPEGMLLSEGFHDAELPLRHPAMTANVVGASRRFMMSVDGGNIGFEAGRYTMAGIYKAQALMNRRKDVLSRRPAFWQFYVPAMHAILRDNLR